MTTKAINILEIEINKTEQKIAFYEGHRLDYIRRGDRDNEKRCSERIDKNLWYIGNLLFVIGEMKKAGA